MVTMSFGDHIEELRVRLILALLGLFVGVVIAFIPPFFLGRQVMTKMQEPATQALQEFYAEDAQRRDEEAKAASEQAPTGPDRDRRRRLRPPDPRARPRRQAPRPGHGSRARRSS